MLPHTTKRTTTNLKTKNNQKWQYWTVWKSNNQGVKEETLTQTIGGMETGSRAERTHGKVVAGGPGWLAAGRLGGPIFVCRYTGRNNWGARQTIQPRVPVWENKTSESLTEKICGGWGSRRNSQPHRTVHWRDLQGPRMYTNPPTWESAPEGPNLLVSSRGGNWKPAESRASNIVPSRTPLPNTVPQHSNVDSPSLVNT